MAVYTFRVQYNDGSFFPSTLEETKKREHSYEDIDRENLKYFDVIDLNTEKLVLRLHFDIPDENRRLIWRRRHVMGPHEEKEVVLAGWQQTVKGVNVQSICYLFQDGHIEMSGDWKQAAPLFSAPEFKDWE